MIQMNEFSMSNLTLDIYVKPDINFLFLSTCNTYTTTTWDAYIYKGRRVYLSAKIK